MSSHQGSQGSHFFHNLTALHLGYLTIAPGATREQPVQESWLDWTWFESQPAYIETDHLRLLRLSEPLVAVLDGRRGVGLLIRQAGANGKLLGCLAGDHGPRS